MRKVRATEDGIARYAPRQTTVEPVFGQIKKHVVSAGSVYEACRT